MLSIGTIAKVIVNVMRTNAQPTSWDTGLLLVKDSDFTDEKRLRSYASSADAAAGLIADGFDDSTEAYKAALKYFASSPSSERLLVSCYPASETSAEALDAVLVLTSDFYGVAGGYANRRGNAGTEHAPGRAGQADDAVPGALRDGCFGCCSGFAAGQTACCRIPAGDCHIRDCCFGRSRRDGMRDGAAVGARIFGLCPLL